MDWLLEEEQGSNSQVHSRGDFSSYDLNVRIYGSNYDFGLPPDKSRVCVVYFHVWYTAPETQLDQNGAQFPPLRAPPPQFLGQSSLGCLSSTCASPNLGDPG